MTTITNYYNKSKKFGSEKYFGSKKMLGPKNIESKKNLGRKNILGQKKMLGPKNIESKKFWVWKKCWSEIFLDGNKFGVKKLWVRNASSKKMLGQKPP